VVEGRTKRSRPELVDPALLQELRAIHPSFGSATPIFLKIPPEG
jgi:hypothetical protein